MQLASGLDNGLEKLVLGVVKNDVGQTVVPVTVTLVVNDGVTTFVLTGTPDISSDNLISYTWTTADVALIAINIPRLYLRARWTITDAGPIVYKRMQYFDVVAVKILTGVDDSALIAEWPLLESYRDTVSGFATGGDTNTVYDTKRRSEPSGFWVGSRIRFTTGGNAGEESVITGYDGSDSELTLGRSMPYAITAGTGYELQRTYKPVIDSAFRRVMQRLTARFDADKVARMVDGSDLERPHLMLSLAYAARQLSHSPGAASEYGMAYKDFSGEYESAMNEVFIKFDATDVTSDGVYDEDSTDEAIIPIRIWRR